ncbi:ubiquitin-conjugating enzyme/RWD-like protein [Durotheca rogersii]|uniref:ubiquitin-conjugating enzyme/RWD-like protein n=1 Tax=Durotheca rogersii TaxID=419775 RepID=UPI00221EEE2F|nr:ubiquitin-conjugating enzyme/RWD-like protein [Durotheca rogersii]KAI5866894.1 ubiquitin-conjugating enzyme/RWD-like protein [Durotheca rogersii]
MSSRSSALPASSARNAAKRLFHELKIWEKERETETGIERLGPVSEGELLHWEAVINGRGVGFGYDEGRWLLDIAIPVTYPLQPPRIAFRTPVVHANVALRGGEICLDLLKDAWTPAYSVLECVRAVRMLLACPETDSPLNVDVAALLRGGDALGARRLVEFWVRDEGGRYEGR